MSIRAIARSYWQRVTHKPRKALLKERQRGRFLAFATEHDQCCGEAARWVITRAEWSEEAFNPALDLAYHEAARRGCTLHGWQRQFSLYYHVGRALGWF